MGEESAKIGFRVPVLSNRTNSRLRHIYAVNNVPNVVCVDWLKPVTDASAFVFVPVLSSIAFCWTRAGWYALAGAFSDIPVEIGCTAVVRNAHAGAGC